jgi:hypothetical protein
MVIPEYMFCISQCRARSIALRLRLYFTNAKPPAALIRTKLGTTMPTDTGTLRLGLDDERLDWVVMVVTVVVVGASSVVIV